MEEIKVKKFGASCGKHGSSTFYKAFKYKKDGITKIITLGQFFFMKIFDSIPVCIAELQLVWEDKHSSSDLVSVRLYFLPECTPEGRQTNHGEDEVLAYYEKIVLKLSDLASMIVHHVSWSEGRRAFTASSHPTDPAFAELAEAFSMNSFGLDNRDIEKEKKATDVSGEEDKSPDVMVMSYARYCRYRCMLKRLEHCEDKWLRHTLVSAIGGFAAAKANNLVYFCKDTFEHGDLDDFELRCDHLAPNLKGRPKKKKTSLSSGRREAGDDVESEESSCSSSFSSQTDGATAGKIRTGSRDTPLRNGFRIDKVKVSKDEQAFLIDLHKFMKSRSTPIGRIPSLGFKQIDLFQFYTLAMEIGGYEQITSKRMWKNIYDALGGSAGSTSAATYTRRHYEKLLLPYERYQTELESRSRHHHHHHHGDKRKKVRTENQSTLPGKVPSSEKKTSPNENGKNEPKFKDTKDPVATVTAANSFLHPPLSNGSKEMMSKNLASLTDRALIIKQEIEKMKMRKDAKRLTPQEVRVVVTREPTPKTTPPLKQTHPSKSVVQTKTTSENKSCIASPLVVESPRKKVLVAEKGRRPSGTQKTVRQLLHQNGQEVSDSVSSEMKLERSDHKPRLAVDTEPHSSHSLSHSVEAITSPKVKTEKADVKLAPHLMTSSAQQVPPMVPGYNPSRPMFYPQLVPLAGAMQPVNLPFMLPGFGFQPLGAQVQQLQGMNFGNPAASVKDEKPLHALNKLVSSQSESTVRSSSSSHHQHTSSTPSSHGRHGSHINSVSSPPSAHASFTSPSTQSTTLSHKSSDLLHRPIIPAHSNSTKRQYPYTETNRNTHSPYTSLDNKHGAHVNKDLKRQKVPGSHSAYQSGSSDVEPPVLDLSMKTLKAQEARHSRGESLLFNTSFNSKDKQFVPKSEPLDAPQDLSVKSRPGSSSSMGGGGADRVGGISKGVPLNIPHLSTPAAALHMKREEEGKRAEMTSQAASKLFPSAVTSIGGLPIDLASFVHPAFPQQMLMQGVFPTPLQLQQMIQGQVASGLAASALSPTSALPFMRPDLLHGAPMLFPHGAMTSVAPATMFSPPAPSGVKSGVSNSVQAKR